MTNDDDGTRTRDARAGPFWPDGARLVITLSLTFEAGGEPDRKIPGSLQSFPFDDRHPDLPTVSWYDHGVREGIPRLLDLFDRIPI